MVVVVVVVVSMESHGWEFMLSVSRNLVGRDAQYNGMRQEQGHGEKGGNEYPMFDDHS